MDRTSSAEATEATRAASTLDGPHRCKAFQLMEAPPYRFFLSAVYMTASFISESVRLPQFRRKRNNLSAL